MSQTIHPAAQQGFSAAAQLYQQVRPSYPAELIDWLSQDLGLSEDAQLIDLGAGTGKFLTTLLALSPHVYAVEPIEAMRQQLQQHYPQVQAYAGQSHSMPFTANFADAVFCAQAFHWFSNIESLTEIHRVLKAQGQLLLIWNQRDERCAWVKEIADFLLDFEQDTPRFHSQKWQQAFVEQDLFEATGLKTFAHQHSGTVEHVVSKRLLSTSFIAAMPEAQQREMKAHFEQLVWAHTGLGPQDQIDFPYLTYAYHYRKR